MPDLNSYQQFLNALNFTTLSEILAPADDEEGTYSLNQNYFLPDEFNNFINVHSFHKKFSCLHINCRNVKKNFDGLISFLNSLDFQFSAIGISETWLKSSDNTYNIDGYNFVGNARDNRMGGGVGIYIRSDFDFKHRPDLDVNIDEIESIFIEITTKQKNIIFGIIYRPPNKPVPLFLNSLNQVLSKVNKENKLLYFAGDFNVILLSANSCHQVNDFLDSFLVNSMFPVIYNPTRVTSNSATLIDNIFTNNVDDISSGIIFADISDHFPIYCAHDVKIDNVTNLQNSKRDMCDNNIQKFIGLLKNTNWQIDNDNPSVNYDNFLNHFRVLYDQCFPKVQNIRKSRKFRRDKVWFTDSLRKMCKKKYGLYKVYINDPSPSKENEYKLYRNKCNDEVKKKVKNDYYCKMFSTVESNMKKTWKLINQTMGNKPKQSKIDKLVV